MQVKELPTDESKWTKGAYARDSEGYGVPPSSPDAVSWCLMGAVEHCYGTLNDIVPILLLILVDTISGIIGEVQDIVYSTTEWNDDINTSFIQIRELIEELDI
jgi:hypothetical protein